MDDVFWKGMITDWVLLKLPKPVLQFFMISYFVWAWVAGFAFIVSRDYVLVIAGLASIGLFAVHAIALNRIDFLEKSEKETTSDKRDMK